jgi:Fur family ferric uptake transcriptional regulator
VAHDDTFRAACERAASAGLRVTDARRRVLRALSEAQRPLTLPEILGSDRSLTQSSAYRNLAQLIEATVVERLDTGSDHGHYELSAELRPHHHHLVCTTCGRVVDVHLDPVLESTIDDQGRRLGAEAGFVVQDHRLDLLGICADCAA